MASGTVRPGRSISPAGTIAVSAPLKAKKSTSDVAPSWARRRLGDVLEVLGLDCRKANHDQPISGVILEP